MGVFMNLKNVSIKWKILLISLVGPVIIATILAWQRVDDTRLNAQQTIIDKSKVIVLMAEATRNQMARKLELGLLKSFEQIEPDIVVEAVPVVTAMQTAAVNAEKAGYTFRAPKVNPRNPKNNPTSEELEFLDKLKTEDLEELVVIKDNEIRYLKPIKLTEECLFCHGDPKGELDPTGGTKEGWKTGEIHGAFEIITSLDEVNISIQKAKLNIVFWTSGILVVIAVTVWFLLRSAIIRPLDEASKHVDTIAKGDLTPKIETSNNDEFGQMVKNIDNMALYLRNMIASISSSSDTLQDASLKLGQTSQGINKSTIELNHRSVSVATAAEEMSANMATVAAATEEASTNISLVAESTEDMTKTINDISSSTSQTQLITEKAVQQSDIVSQHVDELGEAAMKIGKVTESITEISEQTNLLALNATIEAARAGEAGKGFAVVANEIKDLAKQTAEATFEIKNQIEGVQNRTNATVQEIQDISKVIKEINEIVSNVALAVEEQTATTIEIAENISQATIGIQEVTENVSQSSIVAEEVAKDISKVSQESTDIKNDSSVLNERSDLLKKLSQDLQNAIQNFKL